MLLKLYWRYLLWDVVTIAAVLAIIKAAGLLVPFVGMVPAALMAVPVILVVLYVILLARTGNLKRTA